MKLLHKIIFWTHLLAGVIAGLVIFIMSFTGVVLMYEPQISEYSEWNARWVTPGPDAKRLSLDELVAKVREGNPDARPAVITVKSDPTASVIGVRIDENRVLPAEIDGSPSRWKIIYGARNFTWGIFSARSFSRRKRNSRA